MISVDDAYVKKFSDLMKRIRKLRLGSLSHEGNVASPAQLALLDWVATNPGCGILNIADGLKLSPPTVSVSIKKMEENGLIERKPHPLDARSVQFYLTQIGQTTYEKNQVFHLEKFHQLLAGLTRQEQKTLIELLDRALQKAEAHTHNDKSQQI